MTNPCRNCGYHKSNDANLISITKESFYTSTLDCVGKRCFVRTKDFGIFFGEVIEKSVDRITLKDSRQIVAVDWNKICLGKKTKFFLLNGVKTVSLTLVAKYGIDKNYAVLCPPAKFREVQPSQVILASEKCCLTIDCVEPEGREKVISDMKNKFLGVN
jgi:hypothetical protein